jgi:type I restriction enzyme S subunit
MNNKWTYKKIGEIGTILRGKGIQKTDFIENGQPCIHYGQIHTVFDVSTNKHLSTISSDLYNKSIIASTGDVLLTLTSEDVEGSCKSTAWLGNYDVAVSSDAAILKHSLNPKFFVYYTRSNSFYAEKAKYARGFKVTHIKTSDIAEIPVPVPSIEKQDSIVSELDKINELIRIKKAQLEDFNCLEQSVFYDMFGTPSSNDKCWDIKKISDVANYFNGTAHEQDIDNDGKYILVNAKFIASKGVIYKRTSVQRFPLYKNDIAMVLSDVPNGKALAKCYLINKDNTYSLNQRICCFRGFGGSPVFLKFVLNRHPYFLSFDDGNGQTNLRKKDVEDFPLIVPPVSLQQSFEQKIAFLENEKEQIASTVNDLETLFASRMQYWFD